MEHNQDIKRSVQEILNRFSADVWKWQGSDIDVPISKQQAFDEIRDSFAYIFHDESYNEFLLQYDNILSKDGRSPRLWIAGLSHLYFALLKNDYNFLDETGFLELAYIDNPKIDKSNNTIWYLSGPKIKKGIYQVQYTDIENGLDASKCFFCNSFSGLLNHLVDYKYE